MERIFWELKTVFHLQLYHFFVSSNQKFVSVNMHIDVTETVICWELKILEIRLYVFVIMWVQLPICYHIIWA